MKRYAPYYFAIVIAILTLAVYTPALRNDFVLWDDNVDVYENVHIRSLDRGFFSWALSTQGKHMWEPLTWMSFAADYALWKNNPAGYHATGIILHAASTVLVLLLVIRLFQTADLLRDGPAVPQNRPGRLVLVTAVLTAALFGLHPLQVEAVAWISARPTVLNGLFSLLCVMAYADYVCAARPAGGPASSSRSLFHTALGNIRAGAGPYVLSFLFFVFALASKVTAVTIPLLFLLLDWYPFRRLTSGRQTAAAVAEKTPFLLLGGVLALVNLMAQKEIGMVDAMTSPSFISRLLVSFKAAAMYAVKMVLPVHLSPYYAYPREASAASFEYLGPVVLAAGIAAALFLSRKKMPVLITAGSSCLIMLLPVIGFVKARDVYMADRYVYLASLGPFLLIALFLSRAFEKAARPALKQFIAAAAVAAGVVLVVLTSSQIAVWRNTIALWSTVIKENPAGDHIAYINRGLAFEAKGDLNSAIGDFAAAIALDYSPHYTYLAYNDRGMTLTEAGRFEEGMADLNRAIALRPDRHLAYYNRGLALAKSGRLEEAIADFTKALSLDPSSVGALVSRGLSFVKTDRPDMAIRDLDKAVALNPYLPDAYLNRAVCNDRLGRADQALADYDRAIALDPSDYFAYGGRGMVLEKMGRLDGAINDMSRALSLKPDLAEGYFRRGEMYGRRGSRELAAEDFRKACSLGSAEACSARDAFDKRMRGSSHEP